MATDHGSGTIDVGLSCLEGGDGGSWHYDWETGLPPGVITGPASPLVGTTRLRTDLHSEDHTIRAAPAPAEDGPGEEADPGEAWLQGTESAITLANQRGTVEMRLRSIDDAEGASCTTSRDLTFDGLGTIGNDLRWEITASTGSYRDAEGSGSADLIASVAPGADNPLRLRVLGDVAVLQPNIAMEVVETYWGLLGVHYLSRDLTVVYRVTNNGDGDSFGVRLVKATSPDGAKLIGPLPFDASINNRAPVPQSIGDLASGESQLVRLRWRLPIPSGNPPCGYVILGCQIQTTLTFEVPDALDVVESPITATVTAVAPNFPPPVVD